MASRTYVPGLRLFVDKIRRYIGKYSSKLENNTSKFLFAVAELLLDIAEILLAVMDAQTLSDGQYDPDVAFDTSVYINQATGAWNKFITTVAEG